VPLLVTHTVPSSAPSSQKAALATQNFICPEVNGTPPDSTVAVIVMIAPVAALVGETDSVVVVLLAANAGKHVRRMTPHSRIGRSAENRKRLLIVADLSLDKYKSQFRVPSQNIPSGLICLGKISRLLFGEQLNKRLNQQFTCGVGGHEGSSYGSNGT